MASFLTILIIIFVSPLYFLLRKRWLGFIGNSILYILAWLTVLIFGLGILFWIFAVIHASFYYRLELLDEATTMMADKVAEKMGTQKELK